MVAALPVQDGVNDRAVAAHDDLRDRSAQNTLARRSRRGGGRPGAHENGTARHELLSLPPPKRRPPPRHPGPPVAPDPASPFQHFLPPPPPPPPPTPHA